MVETGQTDQHISPDDAHNRFSQDALYENLPLVVLAGRPNAGKSTLFNRLLHKRRAITDSVAGVTRDPIEETAFIAQHPIRLMDTGGFKLVRSGTPNEDTMDDLVVEKTIESLKKADKIVLVLDAKESSAEDEEFIHFLRPFWDKILVAVNKAEDERLQMAAYNYLSYGFKQLICISAEHGLNIAQLCEQIVADLDFSRVVQVASQEQSIRVSVIGKPNTGKSTLTNFLTKTHKSIVSNIAGTTRDAIEGRFVYKKRHFSIVDTAGIRRKARVHENIEYYSVMRALKSLDSADIVFHLIDVQEGLTEQDKKIILQASNRGLGIIFVLNKCDLLKDEPKRLKQLKNDISIMFGKMSYAPVVTISAQTGQGVSLLLDTALQVFKQLNTKIETSALNLALADWLEQYPPSTARFSSFSLKYMVQTGTAPVKFLVFANKPDKIPERYIRYLQNRIRRDLGFSLIPLFISIKGSRKRWEERV